MAVDTARILGILEEVLQERFRQHAKHGDQAHLPDGTAIYEDLAKLRATNARSHCAAAAKAGTLTFRDILEEVARG